MACALLASLLGRGLEAPGAIDETVAVFWQEIERLARMLQAVPAHAI
jgi:hypothetical protein